MIACRLTIVALALAACSDRDATKPAPAPTLVGRFRACSASAPCVAPLTCVSFATEGGVATSNCQLRCDHHDGEPACPAGERCVVVSDSPSDVCMP